MIVFLSNGHDWFLSDCYTQYTVVILAGLPGFYYISHAEHAFRYLYMLFQKSRYLKTCNSIKRYSGFC